MYMCVRLKRVQMNVCIWCVKSTREPGTYSVERELQVLVDMGCYSDITTFADNYQLIDNSLWLIDNIRDNL